MSDIANLSDTIIPKSDQLNAEQLLGGPITITITSVRRGNDDQPVILNYQDDAGRPYKPCKSMRKVLIFAWGDDGREWVGRSMTLFNNPEVKFGGVKVGGIRISHLSHIERDIALSLTATKGKKEPFVIKKLTGTPAAKQTKQDTKAAEPTGPSEADVKAAKRQLMAEAEKGMAALKEAWKATRVDIAKAISPDGKCPDALKEMATKADEAAAEAKRKAEEEAAAAAAAAAAAGQEAADEINDDDMF